MNKKTWNWLRTDYRVSRWEKIVGVQLADSCFDMSWNPNEFQTDNIGSGSLAHMSNFTGRLLELKHKCYSWSKVEKGFFNIITGYDMVLVLFSFYLLSSILTLAPPCDEDLSGCCHIMKKVNNKIMHPYCEVYGLM